MKFELSTDYEALYELVRKGKEVDCVKYGKTEVFYTYSGNGFIRLSDSYVFLKDKQGFISLCNRLQVQYYKPIEE